MDITPWYTLTNYKHPNQNQDNFISSIQRHIRHYQRDSITVLLEIRKCNVREYVLQENLRSNSNSTKLQGILVALVEIQSKDLFFLFTDAFSSLDTYFFRQVCVCWAIFNEIIKLQIMNKHRLLEPITQSKNTNSK